MARSVDEIKKELAEAEKAAAAGTQGAARTVLNVALDLGDTAQVALAKAAGLIHIPDSDTGDGDGGDGGEDETPNRGGYFGNG